MIRVIRAKTLILLTALFTVLAASCSEPVVISSSFTPAQIAEAIIAAQDDIAVFLIAENASVNDVLLEIRI